MTTTVATDLDLSQLRRRQVEALTRALGHFVTLKSSADGWQPVAPLPSSTDAGGDISVHLERRQLGDKDVYRLTSSIPLDAETSRDTEGPFSTYLSELRDWQSVLECPGIRHMWNYFLGSSTTLEMLDAHTRITRSELRSPVPGQTKEFGHARDLLMVETSLVDPTTVVYLSTSLPTTDDDPVYLRARQKDGRVKRVSSALWAWCIEIGTPLDAVPASPTPASAEVPKRPHPRACVLVSCFLHLDLDTSWKSNNALACRAAANLIPSLVAHLRLHGAPPRLARIGPSIALERREWGQKVWEVAYAVASSATAPAAASGSRLTQKADLDVEQPIIARILDLEAGGSSRPQHQRKVSTLTSYLSSSFERQQQGEASMLGTHAGGIVREGEEVSVVATRARLGSSILEFVVDASKWHQEGYAVDVDLRVLGFGSARQLLESIREMHLAAPELFTKAQRELSWDDFSSEYPEGPDGRRMSLRAWLRERDYRMMRDLAAAHLVRCFSIRGQKGSRYRYLIRIMNPPMVVRVSSGSSDEESTADSTFVGDALQSSDAGAQRAGTYLDRVYRVTVAVRKGAPDGARAGLLVNGQRIDIAPFMLDPSSPPGSRPRLSPPDGSPKRRLRKRSRSRTQSASAQPSAPKPDFLVPPSASSRQALLASTPASRTSTPDNKDALLQSVPVSRRVSAAPSSLSMASRADEGPANDAETNSVNSQQREEGGDSLVDLSELPLGRLRQVGRIPSAQWTAMGTATSGGIAISRTDIPGGVSSDGLAGMVLRAEAVVEGWTIFDILSLLLGDSSSALEPEPGLWAEQRVIEKLSPNTALWRCATKATWAVAARDAVVCRSWCTNQRSTRVDVAECSVGLDAVLDPQLPDISAQDPIRADVGLAGWYLDKSTVPRRRVEDGRNRSSSSATVTASVDAEVASQRRKQHAVRITHYLKYNPRGWLTIGDGSNDGLKRFGAMLGIPGAEANTTAQPMLLPGIPPPGAKEGLVGNITRIVRHLDAHGAPPMVVWSRNARVLSVETGVDHVQFQYRLAPWGAPLHRVATGSSQSGASLAGGNHHQQRAPIMSGFGAASEFIEAEFRIEHRIWAHGSSAQQTQAEGPAHIELTVEPFYTTSAIACFVDPESDPHAMRVRVCHHRTQLLPRVEERESDDGGTAMFIGWPTVHLAVVRRSGKGAPAGSQTVQPSSLVTAKEGAPRVVPSSVPPRLTVNGVPTRVRYLRRDESGHSFYARCLSVPVHDIARLKRPPPPTGDLFLERLPESGPESCAAEEDDAGETDGPPEAGPLVATSHIAIQNYSVHLPEGSGGRVVQPAEYASVVARVFVRIRHEIEMLDPQSQRNQWEQLRRNQETDARSALSLMTAIESHDDGEWTRQGSDTVAGFERICPELHPEIPVTVAVATLRNASVAQVSQLLMQPWETAGWDRVLVAGQRREVEYAQGGTSINYALLQTPLFCDNRDALTVRAARQAAFLPTRQRLRNWQSGGLGDGCGGGLGDYFDPTVTLVEASIPGSQPLSSITRANLPLYAVRVDPIDGFERVRRGDPPLPGPSCRVTVATVLDLGGAIPLALRRTLSARIPQDHIEQLGARLERPLWPRLDVPSRTGRQFNGGATVLGEVLEEDVDGQSVAFYREFEGGRVLHEAVSGGQYTVTMHVSVGGHKGLLKDEVDVTSAPVPVVSEITVDAHCFPRAGGFDISLRTDQAELAPAGNSLPMAADDGAAGIPSGAWIAADGGLAVYVFVLADQAGVRAGDDPRYFLVRVVRLTEEAADFDCTVTIQPRQQSKPQSQGSTWVLDGSSPQIHIACNGQRLRVHRARPLRQALLRVCTSSGVLCVCTECGRVGCQRTLSEDDVPVDYASDAAGAPPSTVRRPSGLESVRGAGSERVVSCSTAPSSLRRRITAPARPVLRREASGALALAPLSATADGNYPASALRDAGFAGRGHLALAVFLPVRRLVIGGSTVGDWLFTGGPRRRAEASTVALLLVLAVGVACACLGAGLGNFIFGV
ncbi:hypothetical protein GGF46_003816 [Coemansia sp. RSA 552]|nr:hypothetical protein GGF46_003816 [Coemansia sp. RSA 552]